MLEPVWKKCGFSENIVQGCQKIVEKILDCSPKYDPVELQATSKLLHAIFTISHDKAAPLAFIQVFFSIFLSFLDVGSYFVVE